MTPIPAGLRAVLFTSLLMSACGGGGGGTGGTPGGDAATGGTGGAGPDAATGGDVTGGAGGGGAIPPVDAGLPLDGHTQPVDQGAVPPDGSPPPGGADAAGGTTDAAGGNAPPTDALVFTDVVVPSDALVSVDGPSPGADIGPDAALADAAAPADATPPADAGQPECLADWDCPDRNYLCVQGQCLFDPVTDACVGQLDLNGPGVFPIDFPPRNVMHQACGFASGPEVAFHLPPTATTYCVSTLGSPGDTVLAVRADCSDDTSDLYCVDDTSSRVRQGEITLSAHDQDFTLLLDSWGDGAPVVLTVTEGECAPRPACTFDSDCAALPDSVCDLGACYPMPGLAACRTMCHDFGTCSAAANTPCVCNGPGHADFYEAACLSSCVYATTQAVPAGAACDALLPAVLAADNGAKNACDPGGDARCVFDVAPGEPVPACRRYADRLVQCIETECPAAADQAALLSDAYAGKCTDSFSSIFELPVASSPVELDRLTALPCNDPELSVRWRTATDFDTALNGDLYLQNFCDTGTPNNDVDLCTAYCSAYDVCVGPTDTLGEARCQAKCQLSDTDRNFAQCAAFALDCDGFYACTHGDLSIDQPDTLAVFPADYTYDATSCFGPLPGESGQMMAVRLFPPTYPYTVDSVEYVSVSAAQYAYDASMAHTVDVWVQQEFNPDLAPNLVGRYEIPADPAGPTPFTSLRPLIQALDPPVVLHEGDILFVGVHLPMVDETGTSMCVAAGNGVAPPDSFWWSGAAAPPYNWTALDTLFAPLPFALFAHGH